MADYYRFVRPSMAWTDTRQDMLTYYKGDPCPVEVNVNVSAWLDATFGGPSGFLRSGRPTGPLVGPCDDFFTGTIPHADPIRLKSFDSKGTMKYKDFIAAQRAGRIVLQPRDVGEFLLHPVAGPSAPVSGAGTLTSWASFSEDVSTTPVFEQCNWSGSWNSVSTYATQTSEFPIRYARNSTHTARQTLYKMGRRFSVASLELPFDPELVRAVAAQLPDLVEVQRNLVTNAVAEANSGVYDLLTEIGEFKTTLSFVFGTLGEILRLSATLKRDMFRAKKRPGATLASIASELASLWMAYRYAVMPLAYSANDILDYYSSTFTPYATVRKGQSTQHNFELPNGWRADGSLESIDRCYVKTRFALDLALHDLKFNPLSTAWELIPLSFVVDWVFNVGDTLSALVSPRGIAERAVQYSKQIRDQHVVISRTDGYGGHFVLTGSSYRALPITPLDHIGLSLDFSMSWKRWLDALALTWGMTKKSYIKGS